MAAARGALSLDQGPSVQPGPGKPRESEAGCGSVSGHSSGPAAGLPAVEAMAPQDAAAAAPLSCQLPPSLRPPCVPLPASTSCGQRGGLEPSESPRAGVVGQGLLGQDKAGLALTRGAHQSAQGARMDRAGGLTVQAPHGRLTCPPRQSGASGFFLFGAPPPPAASSFSSGADTTSPSPAAQPCRGLHGPAPAGTQWALPLPPPQHILKP